MHVFLRLIESIAINSSLSYHLICARKIKSVKQTMKHCEWADLKFFLGGFLSWSQSIKIFCWKGKSARKEPLRTTAVILEPSLTLYRLFSASIYANYMDVIMNIQENPLHAVYVLYIKHVGNYESPNLSQLVIFCLFSVWHCKIDIRFFNLNGKMHLKIHHLCSLWKNFERSSSPHIVAL